MKIPEADGLFRLKLILTGAYEGEVKELGNLKVENAEASMGN